MPANAANVLSIRSLPGGRFLLHGYILGERVRKRSRDVAALALLKEKHEQRVREFENTVGAGTQLRETRLTPAQLVDAEAAIRMADGHSLVAWLTAAKLANVRLSSAEVGCKYALTEWLAVLRARKRSERTADKNKRRVESFLKATVAKTLTDITPAAIERYVYRKDAADYTKLTDAQVLKAWLTFCTARSRRWLLVSPFEIDMKDLTATARPKEPGRILSPEQCHAYLAAARAYKGGLLVPYVILTTWCMMRESEARARTKADFKLDGAVPVIRVGGVKRGTPKMRTVTVPANVLSLLREAVKDWPDTQRVPFARGPWMTIREHAGLITRGKTTRHKRRPILSSLWQADIARHTGISYLYQQTGDIKEVCRQAGNTDAVSFRYYLTLPEEGAAAKFYGAG